jgi:hypothetical protein
MIRLYISARSGSPTTSFFVKAEPGITEQAPNRALAADNARLGELLRATALRCASETSPGISSPASNA